jgi:anti-anti-sigma factor
MLWEAPIMNAEPNEESHGFRTEEDEDAFVIHVSGEIDLANAFRLEDALKRGLKSGRGIVVDLREARYIDSAGLKLLFAYQNHALEHGHHIVATEATPNIRKIFEIVQFTAVIPMVASIREAVELLRAKRVSPTS